MKWMLVCALFFSASLISMNKLVIERKVISVALARFRWEQITLDRLFFTILPPEVVHKIVKKAYEDDFKTFFGEKAKFDAWVCVNKEYRERLIITEKNRCPEYKACITSPQMKKADTVANEVYCAEQAKFDLHAYRDGAVQITHKKDRTLFVSVSFPSQKNAISALLQWTDFCGISYAIIGYADGTLLLNAVDYNGKLFSEENPTVISHENIVPGPICYLAPGFDGHSVLFATNNHFGILRLRYNNFAIVPNNREFATLPYQSCSAKYWYALSPQQMFITGLGAREADGIDKGILIEHEDKMVGLCYAYSSEDFDAINNCTFSPQQASLIYRLIDDQKQKKVSVLTDEDEPVFKGLSGKLQYLLLEKGLSETEKGPDKPLSF